MNIRAITALGIIAFLATFLINSQPHRVHHLLESLPNPTDTVGHEKPVSTSSAAQSASAPGSTQERAAKAPTQKNPQVHKHTHQHGHRHAPHTHDHGREAPATEVVQAAQNKALTQDHKSEPRHTRTPKNDANHSDTASTQCTFQAAVQQTHLNLAACLVLAVELGETSKPHTDPSPNHLVIRHNPSSPRAPPRA